MTLARRAVWNRAPVSEQAMELTSLDGVWRRTTPLHRAAGAAGEGQIRYAAPRLGMGETVTSTLIPARASMSTRASMLKRSMRPRTKSLMRGWVTPRSTAALAYVRSRSWMSFRMVNMSVERTSRTTVLYH